MFEISTPESPRPAMFTAHALGSRLASTLLTAALLPCCALGFDATVPSFDASAVQDTAGRPDAPGVDVDSEVDGRVDVGQQDADDTSADVDPQDADDTSADVPFDSDAADSAGDGHSPLSVRVTAPLAGDYALGEVMQVAWTASGAESATLSLVQAAECDLGAEVVVVTVVAELEASMGAYDWAVPETIAPGDYRVRVVVGSTGQQASGCSPVFALVVRPECEALGCAAQNRGCSTASGSPVCGACVEGFMDAEGICLPVDCGTAPAAPANTQFESVSSTQFGGVVTYTCVEGHSTTALAGGGREVTRRCGGEGDWEGVTAACLPVDCGVSPTAAPNARLIGIDRTTFGGTATYSCAVGFVVSGETRADYAVTCGADGAWSAGATCELVDCGPLSRPPDGSVTTASGTLFGATATYACTVGYTLTGSATRICEVSGAWSGSAPVCSPVNCGAPPTLTNGSRTFTSTTYSSTASYSCNSGYTRAGSATLTCGATGSWGTEPTCEDTNECTSGSVCAATGNSCTNTTGSWQCSCAAGYTGTTVTAGNASCSLAPSVLGGTCIADSQCPSSSWCSTVSGQRRCSPRVFSGAAHQMDFVFIPSGTSQLGTPGATNEEQPYMATISRNYFVSRTEVTQGQWRAGTGGTNPSYFQNTACTDGTCSSTENANNSGPVEQVDWYSTLAYANWLSTNQGLSPCYTLTPSTCADSVSDWAGGDTACSGATFTGLTCTGYRLLTESEWERAARGGTTSTYYWGEATDTATVGLYAWFNGNAGRRTHAVGGKQANAYGLFDVSGNVWEWVWDWVYSSSAWITYPMGSATDYVGPASGSARGIRGGGWNGGTSNLRSAGRDNGGTPSRRGFDFGFRLARTAN